MTVEQVDRTVVTETPAANSTRVASATETRTSMWDPGRAELTRRVMVLIFGLIQIVIGLRFLMLLLDAREANGLVSGVLNVSQLFVAPFQGILGKDALHSAGSTFDVTAIVAFIGWTVLELIVIWAVGIFRRPQTA